VNLEEEGSEMLGKALANLKKLTILELNLKDTMIANEGMKYLTKGLRGHVNLRNLHLNLQQFLNKSKIFSNHYKFLVANLIIQAPCIWKNCSRNSPN